MSAFHIKTIQLRISLMAFVLLLLWSPTIHAQQPDLDSLNIITEPAEDEYDSITSEKENKYFSPLYLNRFTSDSTELRKWPSKVIDSLKDANDFWYANTFFSKEKEKQYDSSSKKSNEWLNTLFWLLIIGGFSGFLIWYLAGSQVGLFRKKSKQIVSSEEEEAITEDIFSINYQKEIDRAATQGNYRFAVRLLFLRLLKDLSDKHVIQYKQDRTNFDYLMQLQPTKYYEDFFRITRNYEYSWYGQFDLTEHAYSIIKNDVDNFATKLR